MGRIKALLLRFFGLLLRGLGAERATALLVAATANLAAALPADRALRFLLDLDSRLYPLQGEAAVRHGDGLHIKHRLMRYHEFFIQRILPGQAVLDIGCGNGTVAHAIAHRCSADVVGIDHSQARIEEARRRYCLPNLNFVCGDALADLPDKTFDVVILSNVLEHVELRLEFLQALRQRIQPTLLLVRVPLFERDWRVAAKRELGLEWRLDATHFIEYDMETFLAEAHGGGYRVAESQVRWGEIWAVLREESP